MNELITVSDEVRQAFGNVQLLDELLDHINTCFRMLQQLAAAQNLRLSKPPAIHLALVGKMTV